MMTSVKALAVSAFMGAAVLFTPASTASAQVSNIGNNLVNVQVGKVVVNDAVDLAVAANAVVQLCGTDVTVPVALLAAQYVDQTGKKRTLCETAQGPIRIVQD